MSLQAELSVEIASAATAPPSSVSPPTDSAETDQARQPSVTVIGPAAGWQPLNVRELWDFRELLFYLAWRDVKVRYKQTLLGAAWAVLQPAMMMLVFTIFFGKMAGVSSGTLPYPIFCYLGLLPWTFFSTAISNAGNSVVGSERLITKIYFPRLAIPFASVGAAVVDFAIAFALLVVLMFCYGIKPGLGVLFVPAIFLVIMLAALGVGTVLAALNVSYRDFRYVIPFLVQVWMFATPTVYMQPAKASSGPLQALLILNPMTALVAAFRAACCGQPIAWGGFGLSALFAASVFLAGCLYFRRTERNFADII